MDRVFIVTATKFYASRSQQNRKKLQLTAEARRVRAAQNSQHSKASNAVLVTQSRAKEVLKSFHGFEASNLVTATLEFGLSSRKPRFTSGDFRFLLDTSFWIATTSYFRFLRV